LLVYTVIFWLKVPETTPLLREKGEAKQKGYRLKSFLTNHYPVLTLMLLTIPISFFHAQAETNYRLYAEHIFTHYLSVLAILSTCQSIMMLAFEIVFVKWTEKLPMTPIIIISYGCYAMTAFLYGSATSLWPLIIAQFTLTLGQSIGLNHMLRLVSQMASANQRGLYFALYGSHWDLSRMAGPFVGGMILIHFGGHTLFYIAATFLIAGGIGQFIFMNFIEKRETQNLAEKAKII